MSRKDRLALTESCRDLVGLLGVLQRGDREDLARHLARCPACRKLVADAVRGMVRGRGEGPPDELQVLAGTLAGRDEGEDPVVQVAGGARGILEVGGAAAAGPVGRSAEWRLEIDHRLGRFLISVESIETRRGGAGPGAFVLRVHEAPGGQAGDPPKVVLREGDGEPVAPARRLREPLGWTALGAGDYVLISAGSRGRAAVALQLCWR